MTQDQFSLQTRIDSNMIKIRHLEAKQVLYSSPNFFDGVKLNDIKGEMNDIYLENDLHYAELDKIYDKQAEENKNSGVKALAEEAYYGDQEALDQLIAMAKKNPEAGAYAKSVLCELAANGDQSTAKTLLDAFGKDGMILSALVKGNSAYAEQAAAQITDLIGMSGTRNGQSADVQWTSELEKVVLEKLCKDPESNVERIARFAHTGRGAQALSNIAIDKPTTYTGQLAARALGKAFIQGSNKVAAVALKGLKAAGSNGNTEAVRTLANIASSNTVSTKKAVQAMDALAEIASSGAQSGSENSNTAMGALIGISQNQRVSPKMRAYAINHLGKLIKQGADPGMNATDALIGLARTSNSPKVAEAARDNIFSAAESNPQVLDKGVDLFTDVAKGHIPANNKVRMHAVDLLGKAVQNNGKNSEKALNSLVELTDNPNKLVSKRAKDNLKTLGIEIKKDEGIPVKENIENQDGKEAKKAQTADLNFIS